MGRVDMNVQDGKVDLVIPRYHFSMSSGAYPKTRELDTRGCTHREIEPTVRNILARVERIEWGWIKKEIYIPEVLESRLSDGNPRLYDLFGRSARGNTDRIGYALVMEPPERNEFTEALPGKVVEIENLALFPGNEGQNRGWKFFTRVMDEIFNEYAYGADTVYWSQSSTNHERLKAYYERKGMEYLGQDMVFNFNLKTETPSPYLESRHYRKSLSKLGAKASVG